MKTLKLNCLCVVLFVLGGAVFSSCNSDSHSSPEQKSMSDMPKSDDSTAAIVARETNDIAWEKHQLRARMVELNNKIDARIADLDKQAKKAGAEAKKQLDEEKVRYEVARDTLKKDFDRFSDATGRKWDALKATISTTVDSLESKLKPD
jgi:cytochrome c556